MKFTRLDRAVTSQDITNGGKIFPLTQLPEGLNRKPLNVILIPTDTVAAVRQAFTRANAMLESNKGMNLEIVVPFKDNKPYFEAVLAADVRAALEEEFLKLEANINRTQRTEVLPEARPRVSPQRPAQPRQNSEAPVYEDEDKSLLKNMWKTAADFFKYLGGSKKKSPQNIFTSFISHVFEAVAKFASQIFKSLFGESTQKQFDSFAKVATAEATRKVGESLAEAFSPIPEAEPALSPASPTMLPSGGPAAASARANNPAAQVPVEQPKSGVLSSLLSRFGL